MIDIRANLCSGSVYLLGELVVCEIGFANAAVNSESKQLESDRDSYETLAWATAQIICYCQQISTAASSVSATNSQSKLQNGSSTALSLDNRSDFTVEYVSNPCILFCDLQLLPGDQKSFVYKEVLPLDAPPSFQGHSIKYFYKLEIATQRISSAIRKITIPFRVLPFETNLLQTAFYQSPSDEVLPSNPFLVETEKITPSDIALEEIQNITSRRSPNFYVISSDIGRVGRFCLFKSSYKLGEDIVGTFNFERATVRCVQILISLQSEEESISTKQVYSKSVSKTHIVSAGYEQCDLTLPVPFHITPDFNTNLIRLSWMLKFEFVITRLEHYDYNNDNNGSWQAPSELPIKTMIWSLPVRILSNSPIQVAQCE